MHAPALSAMVLQGILMAFSIICTPIFWSKLTHFSLTAVRCLEACSSAAPPPGTMPSSTAALVALSASTMRSLRSPTSTSDAPPTLITATPPDSFASRSCSFSLLCRACVQVVHNLYVEILS